MAIYNLYDGGTDFGNPCFHCKQDQKDETELPLFVQPDMRSHGGYGFRHKVNWYDLMTKLSQRYDKTVGDLKVGDKLRIFIQPNHATLENLFVDFKEPVAGFEFKLQSVRNLDLNAKCYENSYDDATGEVKSETSNVLPPNSPIGATVAKNTQYSFVFTDKPHTAKVDAIELEITALPVNGLAFRDMKLWFARRFVMDGLHI